MPKRKKKVTRKRQNDQWCKSNAVEGEEAESEDLLEKENKNEAEMKNTVDPSSCDVR